MRIIALAPLALLGACGPSENDPGPGGVTVGEAKALDEAAEMLDQRRQRAPTPVDDATRRALSCGNCGE